MFFFFKQKTAYEMRISDWSSDVCSSDLLRHPADLTGRHLRVLRSDRGCDVARHQGVARELVGVEPDPHGVAGTEQARLADSGNTLDREIGRASCRERVCQYV